MPRTHCMLNAEGDVDWPWVVVLLGLLAGVITSYLRIFWFWMRCYFAEQVRDRNPKLFQLAAIFLLCAVCGYAMSIVTFAWPAYRLLAFLLVLLNVFSWRFCRNLEPFRIAFSANRLERELRESLESRAQQLEQEVRARTSEVERMRELADAANRSKSEFLANMSHEIRTPLTAMLGYAESLQDVGDQAKAPFSRLQALETIQSAGNHLLTVINDILDLSKIEAGKLDCEMVRTPFATILGEALELLKPRASAKGISIDVTFRTHVPEWIISDPTRMRQIVLNLVSNAVKFTEKGRVEIIVAASEVNGQERLVIDIQDTGPGLTPEQATNLFTPFTQADSSVTRRHGGSGLGLSISRRLAALMGGTILLEWTEPGVGSRFRICLPLIAEPGSKPVGELPVRAAPVVEIEAAALVLASARILLAEDGKDNQRLFAFVLGKAGAKVDIAENGRIALERLAAAVAEGHPYDLLVTDMQMPEMDGYQLASHLRAARDSIPILALTAHALKDDYQRCLTAGCDAYASKPIKRDELILACSALLANRDSSRREAA